MQTNTFFRYKNVAPYVAIILLSVVYFASIMQVPFHPDESTQIYMSQDMRDIFKRPLALSWQPDKSIDDRMRYRMLDAPLTRYFIGIGLFISQQEATQVDWNWSLNWQENLASGALPDNNLLLAARLSIAWVFPLSLLLLWKILFKNFGEISGWMGMIFFAINSLVLLHTRRAMAESLTVFFIFLLIWAVYNLRKSPWVAGTIAALAYCSKQSTVLWFAIMFAAIIIFSLEEQHNIKAILKNVVLYAVSLIAVIYVLNPFMWQHPIHATTTAITLRQELQVQQFSDIHQNSPDAALSTPLQRISTILGNLVLSSPAAVDTQNYIEALQPQITSYMDVPFNSFFRGINGSILFLVFILTGIYTIFRVPSSNHIRADVLLVTSGLIQFLFLLITVSLPFQRYVMPLVPIAIILFAIGTSKLIELFMQFFQLHKNR